MERDRQLSKREYLQLMPSTMLSTRCSVTISTARPCRSPRCAPPGTRPCSPPRCGSTPAWSTDVIVVATDVSGTTDNIRHFVDLGVLFVDRPPFEACRPFQTGSKGFLLGEASVAFVVARQTEPAYLRVRGGAVTHDGFHVDVDRSRPTPRSAAASSSRSPMPASTAARSGT